MRGSCLRFAAVPYSTGQALGEHLERFESEFTFGAQILRLFRLADASIIYAARVTGDAPYGSWVLHVRLPRRLEGHFGITRQFLVYCMNVQELQTRDIVRLKRLVATATHPVESDLAMIVTSDPGMKEKLTDWAAERTAGMILIPLHQTQLEGMITGERAQSALSELISGWISAYNLYDDREPVTGDRFFGRSDLLRDLDRQLAQGAGHVGIFGLRRIGKTSVLLEVRERLRIRPNVVPVFLDLESSPAGAAHAAYRLSEEVAKAIASRSTVSERAIRRSMHLPDHWEDGTPLSLISNVGDYLRSALAGGALSDSRVVLILDEAEILLPNVLSPQEHAVDFFRVLRGVAQETGRLSLVIAGVNATPSESPLLGTEDNPLFGLLSLQYLGPLALEECTEMVRRVGRKMQVRWETPALSLLAEEVGAHPLLARLAASDVVTAHPERPFRPNREHVAEAMREFPRRNNAIFSQMVSSLTRYYPDEYEFLRLVASGDVEFAAELAKESPATLNHLAGYGVLDESSMSVSIPVFNRWLHAHLT